LKESGKSRTKNNFGGEVPNKKLKGREGDPGTSGKKI